MSLAFISLPLPAVINRPRSDRVTRLQRLIARNVPAERLSTPEQEAWRRIVECAGRYGTAPFALGYPLAIADNLAWNDTRIIESQALLVAIGLKIVARECLGETHNSEARAALAACEARLTRSALEQCASLSAREARGWQTIRWLEQGFTAHDAFYSSEHRLQGLCLELGWPKGGLGYFADWAAAKCAAIIGGAAALYQIELGADPSVMVTCAAALFASVQLLDDMLDIYQDLASNDFNLVHSFLGLYGLARLRTGLCPLHDESLGGDGATALLGALAAFRTEAVRWVAGSGLQASLQAFFGEYLNGVWQAIDRAIDHQQVAQRAARLSRHVVHRFAAQLCQPPRAPPS
jgi:hypothetical protein